MDYIVIILIFSIVLFISIHFYLQMRKYNKIYERYIITTKLRILGLNETANIMCMMWER